MTLPNVICPYCRRPAVHHETSEHVYGKDYGAIWRCAQCNALCGCHPDGRPLGTLANKQLRNARMAAHTAFDPLWTQWQLAYPDVPEITPAIKHTVRLRAYRWLAHHMGIPFEQCHIGGFDLKQAVQAMQIIDRERPTALTIRVWAKQVSARGAEAARAALRAHT